jgi:hypothetical protein
MGSAHPELRILSCASWVAHLVSRIPPGLSFLVRTFSNLKRWNLTMSERLRFPLIAFVALLSISSTTISAQVDAGAAIQQQLASQFKVTTVTADRADIVTAGDVVQIHKPGLIMYAVDSPLPASNSYKNGKISQGASGFGNDFKIGVLSQQAGKASVYSKRNFGQEEKCWVTGIQVQRDGVVFLLYSDFYDTTRYYGSLKIQYPIKGSVPPPGAMIAMVQEVLTVVPPTDQPVAAPPPAPEAAPAAPPPPPMPDIAPPPPPDDVPTITLGQTRAQVIAALGQPDKAAKMGTKEILFFKTMKVTFINGKVTKVE